MLSTNQLSVVQILDSIAKTSVKILLSEPFYGHFMMGLPKEISEKIDTAAVSLMNNQTIKLMVNADFWTSLNDDHRYGLIKHEVLHIVLKHLFTMKSYSNKQLYNIAADIVVNQYISPTQLPDGGITIDRFDYLDPMYGIKLERDKDVGYYYEKLNQVLKTSPKMALSAYFSNQNPRPGEKSQIILTDLLANSSPELDRHKFWEDFEKMSEGERKIAEYQANNLIKQTANRVRHKYKNYGNLPGGLVQMLEDILDSMKPEFNWRRILRLFAATSNSSYLKNTIRRPSKRYGTTPGIKVKRRNRLLLAIDTSGSIQMDELLEFFSEIYFIWRQGSEITIVECDTKIHAEYPYKGFPPKEIHGRGGTDFNHPIQHGNEKIMPDALIYFTDGFAAVPTVIPRYPVLWIISSNGLEEESEIYEKLPGKKLKLTA